MEEESVGEEKMNVSSLSASEIDDSIERDNTRKIEALLFIAGRYMDLKELVSFSDVNPIVLKKILSDLEDRYKDSGISIVKQGEKWKMDVSGEFSHLVNRLAGGEAEFSKAEQETLAIIAYKQPIKQSVLIKIRGNKAYDHVKSFVERGLVVKKQMGHTSELSLSESFYDYFHMGDGQKLKEAIEEEG